MKEKIILRLTLFMSLCMRAYLVLLLCERRTLRLCASANRLLSCSDFSCSIRSRISASSQISIQMNSIGIFL